MKLTSVNKLGEKDSKYGQKYWAEVNDSLTPISFNSQSDFRVDDEITYEESARKVSKKGTEYLQLKKVKKVLSSPSEEKSDSAASVGVSGISKEQGDEIIRLLKVMAGESDKEADKKIEDVPEGDVNLDDIPI